MGFNTSSVWIKVAFVCLLLGTLLFVIGYATVSWMSNSRDDYGLWRWKTCGFRSRTCTSYPITSGILSSAGWEGWYRMTQVFETLGLICVAIALLVIFLFVFVDNMRKRSALLAIIIFSFVAVVCMLIGFIIFNNNLEYLSIGWSMGIAITGCILTFVAGVMGVIDLNK